LTFEFGARYHKVFAGYLAIYGYIYDAEKLLKEMNPKVKEARWLCTHGTSDGVLQVEVLQKGGFDIDFKSYDKDHTLVEEELNMIVDWMNKITTK